MYRRWCDDWQRQCDRCAASDTILYLHAAAVRLHDCIDESQSEPSSTRMFPFYETLENVIAQIGRKSRSVVLNN